MNMSEKYKSKYASKKLYLNKNIFIPNAEIRQYYKSMSDIFSFLLCEFASQTRRNVEYGTGHGVNRKRKSGKNIEQSMCQFTHLSN